MRIGTREVGPGQPCAVVAELSNAHNGSLDRMLRLIHAVIQSGADVIKTQAYTVEELVALRGDGKAPEPWGSQGWNMHTLYTKAQTPLTWLPTIAAECDRLGVPWFSSVFGMDSLRVLLDVGCPVFKISHLDCGSRELANLVCATKKPIIISVAHQEPSARYYGVDCEVEWVDCLPDYPTSATDVHLNRMQDLWGLSVHCLEPLVGPLAVARGAHYLEYHLMLADEPSELEANVSLTEKQLASVVQDVRMTEVLLGK